jgi:hypothetical protein
MLAPNFKQALPGLFQGQFGIQHICFGGDSHIKPDFRHTQVFLGQADAFHNTRILFFQLFGRVIHRP